MRRIGFASLIVLGLLSLTFSSAVAAQGDSGDPNDILTTLIPPGEPGDLDIDEEDARFLEFVELFGENTDVADFGTGSKLTGPCGGQAFSYDGDGVLIDAAFDNGDDAPPVDLLESSPDSPVQAFTAGNPFRVASDGVVVYFGFYPRVGDGPLDHVWEITTEGISLDSGGDPNTGRNNRNAGIVDLAEQLPFDLAFKARIEGNIMSNLAPCFGEGHVEFEGAFPLATVPGAVGTVTLLGGIFGLLFNARPAITWKE